MRALAGAAFGVGEADGVEELDGPGAGRLLVEAGSRQPFDEEVADAADRVEGGARVLVDHGDRTGAVAAQVVAGQGEDVRAVDAYGSGYGCSVGQRAQGRLGGGGLARAGLAHQADHFAARHLEGDAVEDGPGGAWQLEGEVVDVEEHGYFLLPSRSAAQTPTTLKDTTTRAMAKPGTRAGRSAPWTTAACPSWTISPQSELGGWAPKPR